MPKTDTIYCRVSPELKLRIEKESVARGGEAEAVIVREALREYFELRDSKKASAVASVYPAHRTSKAALNERRKP